MLSRVIPRRDSGQVQAAVFPVLAGVAQGGRGFAGDQPGAEQEQAVLRETVRRLETQHAAVWREAFDEGREEGIQQTRAELQPVVERMNASLSEMTGLRSEMRHRAEKDVVRLALLIAKRVLHRELAVDEGALTAIARVTFERMTRSESYQVTVNPRFAAAITAALPASQAARVRIEADAACAPGTLIVHSPEGMIDASVEAQLDEIGRGLADRISEPKNGS